MERGEGRERGRGIATALHKMHREQNYANNSAKKFIQLFLMFVKSKSAAAFFIMLLAELNLQHNSPSQLPIPPSPSRPADRPLLSHAGSSN